MSNSVYNTVVLSGPRSELQRFRRQVESCEWPDLLAVHVRPDGFATAEEAWGVRGVKAFDGFKWKGNDLLLRFDTPNGAPQMWVKRLGPGFPQISIRLYADGFESCFAGFLHVQGDHALAEEVISTFDHSAVEMLRRHGAERYFELGTDWHWEADKERAEEEALAEWHLSGAGR